jgi:RHS repeat-associated protein
MQLQPRDALPKIMSARYYGPNIGRFASADLVSPLTLQHRFPEEFDALLGNPLVWNKYAYALNNPLAYVDPTGRSAAAVLTWEALGPAGAAALGEPTPFGEMAWLGLAGAVASYQLGQAIAEARSNKKLFNDAMGLLASAMSDLADPGHSGMDPDDPNWKNVARQFWAKVQRAMQKAEQMGKGKYYNELVKEINRVINEWARRFGLNPHGECLDNKCSGQDPKDGKPKSPGSPGAGDSRMIFP